MLFSSLTNWFSPRGRRPSPRRTPPSRRLRLEGLEGRDVPALFGGLLPDLAAAVQQAAQHAAPQIQVSASNQSVSLGQKMYNFLSSRVGARVGGGECADIAVEALRVAGADFTRTERQGTQDYVWTSNRVARLTNGRQLAGYKFQVGDVIQYNNATFSAGGSSKLAHHTQVVAAVDAKGRITKVFEQNWNHIRKVQLNPIIDLTKLTGGSVSIYRAVARTTHPGLVEFTLVNNTKKTLTYTLQTGSSKTNDTVTQADTANSYRTWTASYSGSARPTLKIGNASLQVRDGVAYELYTLSNGQVGIREV